MVPTGVAVAPEGGAYVNHETVVPFPDGAATVIHVAADGTQTDHWTGLTAGTDLTMGPDGALLRIDLSVGTPISLADLGELGPSCMGGPGAAEAIAAPGDATPAAAEADGSSVTIADFAFGPQELAVTTGTTVTWTNEDWAPHTATAEDGSFDSERLDQGASFEHTFDEPGTFAYHCSFHPGMVGSVVVT
jgi:plastocyanin